MNIITNNQPRPILSWHDLTDAERSDFDWGGAEESGFIRYKGATVCLDEFVRHDLGKWQGVHSLTAFSGFLLRLVDSDSAIIAYYYN
jgi:hypothetical protein